MRSQVTDAQPIPCEAFLKRANRHADIGLFAPRDYETYVEYFGRAVIAASEDAALYVQLQAHTPHRADGETVASWWVIVEPGGTIINHGSRRTKFKEGQPVPYWTGGAEMYLKQFVSAKANQQAPS